MAGDKQLGNIVYQVEMDVAQLIAAQQKVNQRLDQMDGSFNKSSQSAGRFEGALNKVGIAIAGAFTIETARRLIEIGDQRRCVATDKVVAALRQDGKYRR